MDYAFWKEPVVIHERLRPRRSTFFTYGTLFEGKPEKKIYILIYKYKMCKRKQQKKLYSR